MKSSKHLNKKISIESKIHIVNIPKFSKLGQGFYCMILINNSL